MLPHYQDRRKPRLCKPLALLDHPRFSQPLQLIVRRAQQLAQHFVGALADGGRESSTGVLGGPHHEYEWAAA